MQRVVYALCLIFLSAAGARADLSSARDVSYGAHPEHRYDVYYDAAGRDAPVIVMLHGGGWVIGRKEARNVWAAKSRYFVPRGFVFVSVETRLLRDGADPLAQARDLAQAVADIRTRAAEWGGDGRQVILMGHSAGAHLAGLVGADPELRAMAGPLNGVVVLDTGTLDLVDLMNSTPRRVFSRAFGGDPTYWARTSPKEQIDADAPPFLVICRTTTTDVCDRGRSFAAKAGGLGVPVTVTPSEKSHRAINADLGQAPAYTRLVANWIDAALR